MICCLIFFFKQKTAYEMRISDWSSDVCSSDLALGSHRRHRLHRRGDGESGTGQLRGLQGRAHWHDQVAGAGSGESRRHLELRGAGHDRNRYDQITKTAATCSNPHPHPDATTWKTRYNSFLRRLYAE